MPVDRPTFSESWYRVADLRPRLLSTVQIHRQHFRGLTWHVVADPASNQFFRLNEAAYQFVAMLDGRRTVSEAWTVCNGQLGDDAPTQPEAIQLLGQLYTSNLLAAELPPDAEGLFRRYHKRITREIQGYLMNIMFIRIPLLDPDYFLDRWINVFGWIFSWVGAALWLALACVGMYFLVGDWDRLLKQGHDVFQQMTLMQNLPLMYAATVVTKVLHEFGHAFACKKFGRQTGTGGEVHAMGVMFLIFTPLPYCDASSSWAFRSKWHRVVVGLAGMYVELALAAVAAVVWARTSEGTPVNSIAFYVIFIAGVSTVLFNANPLLRYDGYYILSDILEMPNLWQRSRQYTYYLVKRYAWGIRRPFNPGNGAGEKIWLTIYGIASTIYRFVVCAAILYFIADRLFLLGAVLTVAAVIAWVVVPAGKFLHYLFTSNELMRVRGRAMLTTLAVVGGAVVGIGLIDWPDYTRAEGFVEPANFAVLHAGETGFIDRKLGPYQAEPVKAGQTMLTCTNWELEAKEKELLAELDDLDREYHAAFAEKLRLGGAENPQYDLPEDYLKQFATKTEDLAQVRKQLAELTPTASFDGVLVLPKIDYMRGAMVQKGQEYGQLADTSRLVIRAFVAQNDAWLIREAAGRVDIRVRGRPDLEVAGQFSPQDVLPAGENELPSAALGYAAGGDIPVLPSDKEGRQASERLFEIRITPAATVASVEKHTGSVVVMPAKGDRFTVTADANTTVTVDGARTTIGEVKAGMIVDVRQEGGKAKSISAVRLLSGQRVVVRFRAAAKPLAYQWWRAILQMIQKRFHV